MNFLIFFIAFCHIFSIAYAGRPIHIGAIFNERNSELEFVFRTAILEENRRSDKLEFFPLVHYVLPDDSYGAEKIACELASEGVVAIFGPRSIHTTKIVSSICTMLRIPHIIAHWTPGDVKDAADQHNFTRSYFPDNNVYARALAQLVNHWNGFTIIYEDNESLERLQDVLENHEPGNTPVAVRQLPEGDDYQPLLKLVRDSRETHIVIDCSPDKVMKIFQQASVLNMMGKYQTFILTSLDSHILNYTEFVPLASNITTIRLMNPSDNYEVDHALSEWRKNEWALRRGPTMFHIDRIRTETALFYDAVQTFLLAFKESNIKNGYIQSQPLECNEFSQWSQGEELLNDLTQMTARGVTGPIRLDNAGRRINFYMEVTEVIKETGIFNRSAFIDPTTMTLTFMRSSDDVFQQVGQSLHNMTLRVASKIGEPFLYEKKSEDGKALEGNERYEGYSMDLIQKIADLAGFKFVFNIVDGQGSVDPKTKKWDGIIGELLEHRADLGICDLTITHERRSVVDFTMPFMTLGISILYVKGEKTPPGLFSFMSPLSLEVWLLMATAYLCISVLLFFLAKTAADDWENSHPCNQDPDELETIWNMHNCIWLTAGSIMQQGCDILPKAISTRLTAGLWWFFALIVISSYTANLAAFLTMERMEASIESAEDLAKQSLIKYGGVKDGSTMQFFKKSNFSTYQRMWAAMESAEPTVFVKSNEKGVERVEKGNRMYAFLMESTMIEYNCNKNNSLVQVGDLLDSKGYGIALPFDSPFRSHISQKVLNMQEDGTLAVLKKKWWKDQFQIEDKTDEEEETVASDTPELGMDNVGGVFLVLVAGLGVSIFIGICEFLWNVSKISAAEKITQWEAFKSELLFALDIRITSKPVNKVSSEKSSRSVSNRSSESPEADDAKFNLEEKQQNKG